MFRTTYHCPFCGTQVMTRFDEDEKVAAKAHMVSCMQHPYYELLQDLSMKKKEWLEADEQLRLDVQGLVRTVLGPGYVAANTKNAVVDLTNYAKAFKDYSVMLENGALRRKVMRLEETVKEQARLSEAAIKRYTELTDRHYDLRKAFSEVYSAITGKDLVEGAPWSAAVEEIKACWNKAKEVSPPAEVLRGHLLRIYRAIFKRDWEEGTLWSEVVNRILEVVEMKKDRYTAHKNAAAILDEVASDLWAKANKLRGS